MLDLSTPRRVHIVGVGGAGMSAIATILAAMGHVVTGSDAAPSPVLDRLRHDGVAVRVGHDTLTVADAEAVAVSTAVAPDDPEVAAAREAGIPVLRRAEALAALCSLRPTVAVSGTHGKTTTTALLAMALRASGLASSYLVGAPLRAPGGGAWWSDEPGWFVVEADESDGTFVELGARAVIVTNVEPDHLDHWGSFADLRAAFATFLAGASGPRVVCVDDPVAAELAADVECLTYGTVPEAEYRLSDVVSGRDGVTFRLDRHGADLGAFRVPLPGLHNARNATAAVVMATALGASGSGIADGLASFPGVARRFEHRGEEAGVTFVDSYDHLPTEVAAALAAARSGGWSRIVCVFQPHRYTRTAALWRDFAVSFDDADVVAVTDVYPAGQAPLPGITGKLIVEAVLDARPGARVAWLPRRRDVLAFLGAELRGGDLCLTLGAGDLTSLPDEALAILRARSPS